MKIFGKKKTDKLDPYKVLVEQIGMDEEELSRENLTDKRREDLRKSIASKYETLARMEQTKKEGWAKVIVGVLAFLGATVPVGITVANYNVQYRRDRNAEDAVQMDYGRSKHSPSNQVGKPN